VGKTKEIHLRLMIKTKMVRNNHKFTLIELPGGSIQLEASQGIVVDLNLKCIKMT
jgi:hypothetical protein